jgi:hypothetical protein
MTDDPALASATGSPVIATIRSQVPEFEAPFQRELDTDGNEVGAFQAMSTFAEWLAERLQASPDDPAVQRAFLVVEEIACSRAYPMGVSWSQSSSKPFRATRAPSRSWGRRPSDSTDGTRPHIGRCG